MTTMLPPLQRKKSSCTLFQQTFCERRRGLCSALGKLFPLSCDLRVLRVVLTSPQPTTHTRDSSHVTIRGGGGGNEWVSSGRGVQLTGPLLSRWGWGGMGWGATTVKAAQGQSLGQIQKGAHCQR